MKRFLLAVLSITVIILSIPVYSFAESGNIYYIDSFLGDDTNSGTLENPWKNLSAASKKTFSAGDKILLKCGGTYTGTFQASGSGTRQKPIVLSSYGDEATDGKPVITVSGKNTVILLKNTDYWTIKNLEITAPDGRGISVSANNGYVSDGIEIRNCTFHDIYYYETTTYNNSCNAISISASGYNSKVNNLTMSGLNIYKCGYGIVMSGVSAEASSQFYESPEKSYHQNTLLENSSFRNILQDGLIIASSNNMIVRNCKLIDTATASNYPTAALWMHHTNNALVEHCEIAGSTNYHDGMAIDFDGWTTNSTYQYIYSHDNFKFMSNCLYDNVTRNDGNTVRYCLSVNDNGSNTIFSSKQIRESDVSTNYCANLLWSNKYTYDENAPRERMTNFKFYNNTIINALSFDFLQLEDAVIANNIFVGTPVNSLNTLSNYKNYLSCNTDKVINGFDGIMTNNCIYGYADTPSAKNTVYKNPIFASTDISDKNSFMLSRYSPLIGSGIDVEGDNCTEDFFGNPINGKHNIGCYEGSGEKQTILPGAFWGIFDGIAEIISKSFGFVNSLILLFK